MTQHPSKLTFTIEESVWLNKGEEIESILGMSLEPEIRIEEQDQIVCIKGGLRLIGDYKPADQAEPEEEREEPTAFRSIGETSERENGEREITHFLPVDITIPTNRIRSLEEVYVQIETFDYDLPEKSCIQLTADISISGMTSEEETPTKEKEESTVQRVLAEETSFSFEAKKKYEEERVGDQSIEEQVEEPKQYLEEEEKLSKGEIKEEKINETIEVQMASKEEEETREETNQVEQLSASETEEERKDYTPEVVEPSGEAIQDDTEEELDSELNFRQVEADLEEEEIEDTATLKDSIVIDYEEKEETRINISALSENTEEEREEAEEDIQGEIEEQEESLVQKNREENALYLTKMMSKEEERFTTWKMCIIQENESIDMIADRYEMSTNQILRFNRLQGEQVEEGQILYIPVTTNS